MLIPTDPYDCKSKIPYPEDREHATFDPAAVTRAWRVLAEVDAASGIPRPLHRQVEPGALLLAQPRPGRNALLGPRRARAPGAPGGPRGLLAQLSSAGFWFGDDTLQEPAFYCYAWPAPSELDAHLLPAPARWVEAGGAPQARLLYEDWRQLPDPRVVLLGFLQSSYEAAADRAHWERALLERPRGYRIFKLRSAEKPRQ